MSEIKATREIFEAIGLSREKTIELIRSGKLKGTVTDQAIMIDESEVPEGYRTKRNNTPTKEPENEKEKIITQTDWVKAETQRLKAEIELETIRGERDRPEVLKKKESALAAKELELDVRLQTVEVREKDVAQREITLAPKEKFLNERLAGLERECQEKINQATILAQEKLDSADTEVLERTQSLEELDNQISRKQKELADWEARIVKAKEDAQPIIDSIKKYILESHKIAVINQQQKNYAIASSSWKKNDTLKRILSFLGVKNDDKHSKNTTIRL